MGLSTLVTSLLGVILVVCISFVACNPAKRTVIDTDTDEECVVDPGLERRTILLEEAATTWGATLPPMLATMQEMATSMKKRQAPHAEAVSMDCSTLYAEGENTSGIHKLGHHAHNKHIDHHDPFYAYCDMETDGGGWTVIQKRFNGNTHFYRVWESYVNGFGHLDGEQWLGLKKLSQLTSYAKFELRVDLERFNGETTYALYENFAVGDAYDEYQLTVSGYSGTAGDALSSHSTHAFSAKDQDNDNDDGNNCASRWHGAWWYDACESPNQSNLNGHYYGDASNAAGMVWMTTEGLKTSLMRIRRKD